MAVHSPQARAHPIARRLNSRQTHDKSTNAARPPGGGLAVVHSRTGLAGQRPFFVAIRSRHAHQPQCAKIEVNPMSMAEIASKPRKYTPCSIGQFISYLLEPRSGTALPGHSSGPGDGRTPSPYESRGLAGSMPCGTHVPRMHYLSRDRLDFCTRSGWRILTGLNIRVSRHEQM
jgi:hypothetical protein